MATYEYQVKWIARGGNQPHGKDWDAFLNEQSDALKVAGQEGWQLASTTPVDYLGSTGTTFGGVLLYFQRESNFG